MRALVLLRVLVDHRFPDQIRLDAAAKDIVLELDRANRFLVAVYHVNLHVSVPANSNCFPLPASGSFRPQPAGRRQLVAGRRYFFGLGAAFLATVTLPAFSTCGAASFLA